MDLNTKHAYDKACINPNIISEWVKSLQYILGWIEN